MKKYPSQFCSSLLFVIAILFTQNSFAQDSSKVDSAKIPVENVAVSTKFLTEDSVLLKYNPLTKIDTTLDNLHRFRATQYPDKHYLSLGNIAAPATQLVYSPFVNVGYQYGVNVLDVYRLKASDVRYFETTTPYTQLKYVQGDGQLQYLDAYHNQSYNDQIAFGVEYHSRRSEGFYMDENNKQTSVALNFRYKSFSKKYQLMLNGIWNTFNISESGGIENINLFDVFDESQRRTASNFLNNKSAEQYWRDASLNLRQMYFFGKSEQIEVEDSQFVEQIQPRFYATHKLSYTRLKQNFISDSSNFYPTNPDDYTTVFGSVNWSELNNEIGIGWYLSKDVQEAKKEQVFYTGIRFQNVSVKQWDIASITENPSNGISNNKTANNAILFGKLSKMLTPYTHLKASLNYVLVGAQFSDYLLQGNLSQKLINGLYINPFLRAQARDAFYNEGIAIVPVAKFENTNFSKVFSNELGAVLKWKQRTSLSLSAIRTDKFIFFDSLLIPQQAADGINYIKVELAKNFVLGKFNLNHNIVWQTVNNSPLRLPNWYVHLNYYFETDIFKGAGQIRLGAELFYISKAKLNAYMPGLMQFYVQDEKETANYAWADVYFSARVKRWNGFLKLEHVNQGLFGFEYELLPNYALYPRVLRMGVAWRFYD